MAAIPIAKTNGVLIRRSYNAPRRQRRRHQHRSPVTVSGNLSVSDPDSTAMTSATVLLSKPYALRMLKALADISDNRTRLSVVTLVESIAHDRR